MPTPTQGDLHVNAPLTNIAVAMMQDEKNFVADTIFPVVPSDFQSNLYWNFDNADWNRDEMQVRAAGDESEGSGYTVDSSGSFFCKVWAYHHDIPDQLRNNNQSPINLDEAATRICGLKALLRKEIMWASTYMAGAVWTRDYDGVASSPSTNQVLQWNDANSTPIEDVLDAALDVEERTGFRPNVLVLGPRVKRALVRHPDFIDLVKYGQTPGSPAMIDDSDLAQVFEVPRVVTMRAIKNTAKRGATKSHSFIAGKTALLAYAAPAPSIMAPSAGYTFAWTGQVGAGAGGQRVKSFYINEKSSTRVEIEMAIDQKIVAADLGAFWDTVVA